MAAPPTPDALNESPPAQSPVSRPIRLACSACSCSSATWDRKEQGCGECGCFPPASGAFRDFWTRVRPWRSTARLHFVQNVRHHYDVPDGQQSLGVYSDALRAGMRRKAQAYPGHNMRSTVFLPNMTCLKPLWMHCVLLWPMYVYTCLTSRKLPSNLLQFAAGHVLTCGHTVQDSEIHG